MTILNKILTFMHKPADKFRLLHHDDDSGYDLEYAIWKPIEDWASGDLSFILDYGVIKDYHKRENETV